MNTNLCRFSGPTTSAISEKKIQSTETSTNDAMLRSGFSPENALGIALVIRISVPAREIAPYNGFGSEEDSRANCDSLLPKPPQKDFIKFMAKDRSGLNSHELRFVAKLNSENSVDKIRRFVITYFLSDDTISIFEQSGTAHRTNPRLPRVRTD